MAADDPSPSSKAADPRSGAGEESSKAKEEGSDDTPRVGMAFKTHGEACYFYKQYARRVGFGATVKNSLYDAPGECIKLVLACSKCRKPKGGEAFTTKTNCPAAIRFRLKPDGLLHLVKATLEHNHPLDPDMKEICFRKLASRAVPRGQLCHDLIRDDKESQFYRNLFASATKREFLKLENGDETAIGEFFTRMQLKSADFFYSVDMDGEGRIRSLFWVDPVSRAAYQYFGEVVSIDTTCFINKGDTNLVLFLGVNHNGQPVLLGCGLVSDETTESFVWVCKAWLAAMSGKPPNAVVTDQYKAIEEAVSCVFPGACHRFCLGSMVRKTMEKIRAKVRVFRERDALRNTFKKVVYDSLRSDEFDNGWRDMIEKFGLRTSEWFSLLYEKRRSWVPVFLKDTFWAGVCSDQCCRAMTKYFDDFVHPKTSLRDFVKIYEMALQSKYGKEAQTDTESVHKPQPLISKFYMEEQLSKLYTNNIFIKFQSELKNTMYCDASLLSVDGMISTFNVKESVFHGDVTESAYKEYEVIYYANEAGMHCICGYFKLHGILCRHALSVLKFQQVYEIPSQYILSRYRKDYKLCHALARPSNNFLANNLAERYAYLSMRCLQLVDMGAMSDEKYQLASSLIEEVEKLVFNDSATGDRQQIAAHYNSMPNEIIRGRLLSLPATSKGDNTIGSSQVKRRGVPPKKRKAPGLEAINTPNNGDSNPTAISFGGHFGGNIQHHSGNLFGEQFNKATQSTFDPQSIGNHSMSWLYQRVPQEDNLPRMPLG